MPDYEYLRTAITQKLTEDSVAEAEPAIPSPKPPPAHGEHITISAPTLYTALQHAASELGCALADLSYRILEEKDAAFEHNPEDAATERDPVVTIRAQRKELLDEHIAEIIEGDTSPDSARYIPPPYSIKKQNGEILLALDSAHPQFQALTPKELGAALYARTFQRIKTDELAGYLRAPESEYRVIGTFQHNIQEDAHAKIEFSNDFHVAWLTLTAPRKHGSDFSSWRLLNLLKKKDVTHGIRMHVTEEIEKYPRYNYKYVIARGTRPIHGSDGRVELSYFLRDTHEYTDKDIERINYKSRSAIINVIKGSVIAYLTPAERGKDGKDVCGTIIPARDGEPKELKAGKNTRLSDSGNEVIATEHGQLKFLDGRFVVETKCRIDGSVGVKTGNILFLGDVSISGNVDDGFSVKASGNIEVYGFVGAAFLDSESKIKIHKGIAGKGRAFINSEGDCIAKYIENATVHAGASVIVGGSIIKSNIVAGEKIRCAGTKANIMGGIAKSGVEVSAKDIGSEVNERTRISVGYDPFRLLRIEMLNAHCATLSTRISHLRLRQRKTPADSASARDGAAPSKSMRIQQEVAELEAELARLNEDIDILNEELKATQQKGRVVVTKNLYNNVEVSINGVTQLLHRDYTNVVLAAEGKRIVNARTKKADV